MTLRVDGADISHHQAGKLDFNAAKRAGVKWLYHKATEGTTFQDELYRTRRRQAKDAQLPFGAYHFAHPNKGDAKEEARYFLKFADPRPGDLRPALDLEVTEGMSLPELRSWARSFILEVQRLVHVKPIVYTPFDLGPATAGCLLWRPRYSSDNREPELKWDIFQFSNGVLGVPNKVAGLGPVDLNHMRTGIRPSQLLVPHPRPVKKPEPEPTPPPAPAPPGQGEPGAPPAPATPRPLTPLQRVRRDLLKLLKGSKGPRRRRIQQALEALKRK